MRLVLDASVIVKWMLTDPDNESDTARAGTVLERIGSGADDAIMPAHWLAEVAAVLCRLSPQTAREDTRNLHFLDFDVLDDEDVYQRAVGLAIDLQHHLFDTLYHAVALQANATLVTADRHYWRKAMARGHIALLSQFSW